VIVSCTKKKVKEGKKQPVTSPPRLTTFLHRARGWAGHHREHGREERYERLWRVAWS